MIRIAVATLVALAAIVGAGRADAADKLRVGRSPSFLFAYTPADVAMAKGFFAKRNLEIQRIDFNGASKQYAAMVAGAIDVALGSPTGMALEVKGMEAKGIAVICRPMLELGIIVPWDSPIKTLDDLKGKRIGIATAGSITHWLALELERVKGWPKGSLQLASIGSGSGAAETALRTHIVDADIGNATLGIVLARTKRGRLLATGADFVKHFIMHETYASDKILKENPDAVRHFLAGWYEAVAWMRSHREETIEIARKATGLTKAEQEGEYDRLMSSLSTDGRFDPQDITRIGKSFVELKMLPKEPDMSKLYTEAYLPAK